MREILFIENTFIIAHYISQFCRPNLEIYLGMAASKSVSYPEFDSAQIQTQIQMKMNSTKQSEDDNSLSICSKMKQISL